MLKSKSAKIQVPADLMNEVLFGTIYPMILSKHPFYELANARCPDMMQNLCGVSLLFVFLIFQGRWRVQKLCAGICQFLFENIARNINPRKIYRCGMIVVPSIKSHLSSSERMPITEIWRPESGKAACIARLWENRPDDSPYVSMFRL